jgi:glycosyltransferase involved in cell wall biosynthesis
VSARPLTIAVLTTLNDNLIRAKMVPLSRAGQVERILLVTDVPGPPVPKLRYVIPPRWLYLLSLHKSAAKFWMLLWALISSRAPVVMAYNVLPHGYSAWLAGRLCRRQVWQHLIGGEADITVAPETSDNSLVQRWPFLSRWLTALCIFVIRRSDRIFVPGAETRRRVVDGLGVAEAKVAVLHSAVDCRRFRPAPGGREFDVLLVAALRRRKRVDIFLRALALVAESLPQVRAAVLGEGPARAELERLSRALGLAEKVAFLGYRADLEKMYTKARVFVLTSALEGLSCASMEAMACGLAVVVPDVGDMREIALDGETGYLVRETGRPEEYARRIVELLSRPELLAHCAETGTALIREQHSIEAAEAAWREILERMPA